MSISTHVLDATTGRPAAGLELALSRQDGDRLAGTEPPAPTRRRTAGSPDLAGARGGLTYRIVFLTEAYLKARSPRRRRSTRKSW